jgi:hypothetical protein
VLLRQPVMWLQSSVLLLLRLLLLQGLVRCLLAAAEVCTLQEGSCSIGSST